MASIVNRLLFYWQSHKQIVNVDEKIGLGDACRSDTVQLSRLKDNAVSARRDMSYFSAKSLERIRGTLETQHQVIFSPDFFDQGAQCVVLKGQVQEVECAIRIAKRRISSRAADDKSREEMMLELFGPGWTPHPGIVSPLPQPLQLKDNVLHGHLVTFWEFCSGGSLRDRLNDSPEGFGAEEILLWIKEIAEAVDHLNELGIYHRDVKPANILLSHGHAKLADLGMAKFIGGSSGRHSLVGTPEYMPLELLQTNDAINGRGQGVVKLNRTIDSFSLAVTYFELRTGNLPFGNTAGEIIRRQEQRQLDVLALEEWERDAVRTALARHWQERPESARAWVSSLVRAARTAAGGSVEHEPPEVQDHAFAKRVEIYQSIETELHERAEAAELAKNAAMEEAGQAKRKRLHSAAEAHLRREEWQALYEASCDLLNECPNDADGELWRGIALKECVPEDIYVRAYVILRSRQLGILESRRLTKRALFAIIGAVLSLTSTSAAYSASARIAENTAHLVGLMISGPMLAFSLLTIVLTPFVRGATADQKVWGWLAVVFILIFASPFFPALYKTFDSAVILTSLGTVWFIGLVLMFDRRAEPFLGPPGPRASRRRRKKAIAKAQSTEEVELKSNLWKDAFESRAPEVWAFYKDVWPNE